MKAITKTHRNLILLLMALVLLGVAAYLVTHDRRGKTDGAASILIESLPKDEIREIKITEEGRELVLVKKPDGWKMGNGFTASSAKVGKFLEDIRNAPSFGQRGEGEAQQKSVGVLLPLEGAGKHIRLYAESPEPVTDIIVGKQLDEGRFFARYSKDSGILLIGLPRISGANPAEWIDAELAELRALSASYITLGIGEKEKVVLRLVDTKNGAWRVDNMPAKHAMRPNAPVGILPSLLATIEIADMAEIRGLKADGQRWRSEFGTLQNISVFFTTARAGGKYWTHISMASNDPAQQNLVTRFNQTYGAYAFVLNPAFEEALLYRMPNLVMEK